MMLTFHANPKHLSKALGEEVSDINNNLENRLGVNKKDDVGLGVNTEERLGVNVKIEEGLGETKTIIIENIIENPKITIMQMAEKLKISSTSIEKHISYLKLHGYLMRIGSDKSGHWEVLK